MTERVIQEPFSFRLVNTPRHTPAQASSDCSMAVIDRIDCLLSVYMFDCVLKFKPALRPGLQACNSSTGTGMTGTTRNGRWSLPRRSTTTTTTATAKTAHRPPPPEGSAALRAGKISFNPRPSHAPAHFCCRTSTECTLFLPGYLLVYMSLCYAVLLSSCSGFERTTREHTPRVLILVRLASWRQTGRQTTGRQSALCVLHTCMAYAPK